MKRFAAIVLAISLLMLTFLAYSNWLVGLTSGLCYSNIEKVPARKLALVLGTSKKLKNGNHNLYYTYRIQAAAELYRNAKVKYILVSGDNSTKSYDEPTAMKKDLIAQGVPGDKIFIDYAGFRTLDSIERCLKVFQEENITVVSQQFHNERAVFIAKYKRINAIGYNARDVNLHYGFKTQLREKFARAKAVLDLFLFKTRPKFYGETISIP